MSLRYKLNFIIVLFCHLFESQSSGTINENKMLTFNVVGKHSELAEASVPRGPQDFIFEHFKAAFSDLVGF
jgi:hypothetical protein